MKMHCLSFEHFASTEMYFKCLECHLNIILPISQQREQHQSIDQQRGSRPKRAIPSLLQGFTSRIYKHTPSIL